MATEAELLISKLMGKNKIKSRSAGIYSAMASWFACFGSAGKAAGDSGGPRKAGYHPAAGMVAAAKHFSSAHSVRFG